MWYRGCGVDQNGRGIGRVGCGLERGIGKIGQDWVVWYEHQITKMLHNHLSQERHISRPRLLGPAD